MADVKTILRELSVLVGTYQIVNKKQLSYDSKDFNFLVKSILPKSIHNQITNIDLPLFTSEQNKIVDNGYKLSKLIVSKFNITNLESLKWYGYDSHKEDPVDVSINDLGFSLKEQSFILENMGLYKLVNLFTGSSFDRLHIFEDYAMEDYKKWFSVTLNLLVSFLKSNGNKWTLLNSKKGKKSEIVLLNESIYLCFTSQGISETSILHISDDLNAFKIKTNSITREQVFSKWINKQIKNDSKYLKAKNTCSITAAQGLANYLIENLNYTQGLPRFLRIHEKEYYYAKSTDSAQILYRVPSLKNYTDVLEIESIIGSVPSSQVNIITTIRNKVLNKKLVLRNECRFSHGQFNGTPEAKMYYDTGNSLLVIYENI